MTLLNIYSSILLLSYLQVWPRGKDKIPPQFEKAKSKWPKSYDHSTPPPKSEKTGQKRGERTPFGKFEKSVKMPIPLPPPEVFELGYPCLYNNFKKSMFREWIRIYLYLHYKWFQNLFLSCQMQLLFLFLFIYYHFIF